MEEGAPADDDADGGQAGDGNKEAGDGRLEFEDERGAEEGGEPEEDGAADDAAGAVGAKEVAAVVEVEVGAGYDEEAGAETEEREVARVGGAAGGLDADGAERAFEAEPVAEGESAEAEQRVAEEKAGEQGVLRARVGLGGGHGVASGRAKRAVGAKSKVETWSFERILSREDRLAVRLGNGGWLIRLASGVGIGWLRRVSPSHVQTLFMKVIQGCGVWLACSGLAGGVCVAGGFDAGTGGREVLSLLDGQGDLRLHGGTWLRIRGLSQIEGAAIAKEREALRELRGRGMKICALVEWDEAVWTRGVRPGGGKRVAVDLRELWERARALGREFAGCVDAWEIGNEPDISFLEENAETYAAYLKTCRLGLRAGAKEAGGVGGGLAKDQARVVVAPLALPPGPYFERLWENDAGGATDGFNFHFYGYAEDFSDVYGQFRDAVERGGRGAGKEGARELPVFLTEYGYGLLDGAAGRTEEGRDRQARWFREVGAQLRELRPQAAMAFVLMPYLELGISEFGLLIDDADGSGAAAKGQRLRVSPALAWLLAERTMEGENALSWRVAGGVNESAVVLDFVAGEGLEQRKSFLGYFARGETAGGRSSGVGEVVVYNFSEAAVAGVLRLGAGLSSEGRSELALTLEAGERRMVRVRAEVEAAVFRGVRSETVFSVGDGGGSSVSARLITTWWPDPAVMAVEVVSDFSHEGKTADAVAERLLARWRASEEPALQRQGRWLVSRGVSVAESAGGKWSFKVDALPEEPARPAMVELPLPEGFVFEPGMLLEFAHRLAEGSVEREAWLDVYFRTENGNLYQVWPRLQAARDWRGYAEAAENFTMAFFGRARLPWRFVENRPVALVFFLRPEKLSAIFEIEDAAITRRVVE